MLQAPLSFVRAAVLLLASVALFCSCASKAGVRTETSLDRVRAGDAAASFPGAPPNAGVPETTLDRMRAGVARDVVVFFPRTPAFMSGAPGPLLRVDPPTESLLGLR